MRDKFAGFAALFVVLAVIAWVVGNVTRYTSQWIDWWAVVDALPLVILGIIIAALLVGAFTREKKDGT